MVLNKERRQEIKERLEQAQAEIQAHLEELKTSSQPVSLDDPIGRVSRIDAIQQQQMAKASRAREERRLQQVRRALQQISQDEFGYCQRCEEPIPWERLKVRPENPFCIRCLGGSQKT